MLNIVWYGFDLDRLREPQDSTVTGIHSTIMYQDFFPEGTECFYYSYCDFVPQGEGAVVFVHGSQANQKSYFLERLQKQIDKLSWVVVVSVFDEGSSIQLDQLSHPNMKIWVQEPKPGVNPACTVLPIGMANHDKMRRVPIGYTRWVRHLSSKPEYKSLDWFFAGTEYGTSPEWTSAIRALPGGHYFKVERRLEDNHIVDTMSPWWYMRSMARAKVVPCRPGICTPETSRVYEALEAGCVPIVSKMPGGEGWRIRYNWEHYWEYVLGEKPPFPVIDGPDQLAGAVKEVLDNWEEQSRIVSSWWKDYKIRLVATVRQEVSDLRRAL